MENFVYHMEFGMKKAVGTVKINDEEVCKIEVKQDPEALHQVKHLLEFMTWEGET